jgi:hypothetical protein
MFIYEKFINKLSTFSYNSRIFPSSYRCSPPGRLACTNIAYYIIWSPFIFPVVIYAVTILLYTHILIFLFFLLSLCSNIKYYTCSFFSVSFNLFFVFTSKIIEFHFFNSIQVDSSCICSY